MKKSVRTLTKLLSIQKAQQMNAEGCPIEQIAKAIGKSARVAQTYLVNYQSGDSLQMLIDCERAALSPKKSTH